MPGCPILTYHSQLLFGNDYRNNSHVGLAADLEVIAASGRQIIGLRELVASLRGARDLPLDELVCITFDDGPDFDWLDIEHPEHGPQPSFATLLRRHAAAHPGQRPICATSFVIADAGARHEISTQAMGREWMNDHWWREAAASGLLQIDSHGLDHRHPCLAPGDADWGHFHAIADEVSCAQQVDAANSIIAERSGQPPRIFAYPYGQASEYLRSEYLPRHGQRLGLEAAVSIEPGHFHWDSDPWFLPRYVSLAHWHSPEELASLLRG
ncbi:polysaccharide deacetylase family protein [Pseudomarimonas salicorniae]|uniref:Polysaccharide deacetylase family protein n=1 Tax=Pseudomarimonas salicorniae TaxID=2933270 RepID=A0ABT0GM27_9GAMM|nr:polysaccharide deacetylase family protein [Lysobacter sp. CAU 1642]MCK7595601.1 polysaccharide deacetylase family protein [Lysobacter sp. CAU 1642]